MHNEEKVIFKNSRKLYGVQFIHLYPTLGLHSVALGESSSLPRSDLFQMTGSRALACNVLMCLQLPEELVSFTELGSGGQKCYSSDLRLGKAAERQRTWRCFSKKLR